MHRGDGAAERDDPGDRAGFVGGPRAPRAGNAIALESATRLGFQMNVDSSTAAGETAIRRPATKPAIGPPIDRASHHVTATAATPQTAIIAVTATGSAFDSHAAGVSR